jgi:putative DNA primase/helicase
MNADADRLFRDWKEDALKADMVSEATKRGAKLRKVGSAEYIGPCPACGGKDRFSINTVKRVFNCRGFGGGDVIGMVQHISQVDFLMAGELLAGRAPPRGRGRELSAEEREDLDRRHRENEEAHRRRQAEQEAYERRRVNTAEQIWATRVPLVGTHGEAYLRDRGLDMPPGGWPDCIAFHPALEYELDPAPYGQKPIFPCVIAQVVDVVGELIAVHRIYLDPKAPKKIDREESKVTIGPSVGGAVRIGGIGRAIETGEGLETCLAVGWLTNFERPIWATLGTSGLAGVELPLEVEICRAWPDGDIPMKKVNGEYVPVAVAPGIAAARKLRDRYVPLGVKVPINEPPGIGAKADFLNVWLSVKKMREAEVA